MSVSVVIGTIILTVISGGAVFALFLWGAVKDGQDQREHDARYARRSWPPRED